MEKKYGTDFKNRVTTDFSLKLKASDYSENTGLNGLLLLMENLREQEEANTEEQHTKATELHGKL